MNQSFRTTALTIAAACIVVCLPLKGVAQDSRIAVVDTRMLTLMCDEGKIAGDKLQKRLDVIRTEMDKLRKDIEDKDTNLRTRDRLLSSAAKASLAKEIEDDKFKFDQKAQVYEKEMNEMQTTLLGPIEEKVRLELQSYVVEKAYSLVMDLSAQNPNVVWANVNNDITKDVMVRVNETFKRTGGAAAAPPAAAPKPATTPAATTPRAPAGTTTPPAGQRPPATPPATAPAPAEPKQ
jgi:Skp family chaperone for outer membrane proteins